MEEEDGEDMENAAQAEEGERRLEDEDEEAAFRRQQEEIRRQRNERRADEQLAINFDEILVDGMADVDVQGRWRTQRVDRRRKRQLLRRELQSNDLMTRDQVADIFDQLKLQRVAVAEWFARLTAV